MKKFIVSIAFLLAGCAGAPPLPTPTLVASATPAASPHSESGHHHHHAPPHGGHLVELGEESAHLETVWSADSGRLTVYVLDSEAEKAIRSDTKELTVARAGGAPPVVLKAESNPLTGETPGDTSQFGGKVEGLRGVIRWEGTLQSISVQGQTYTKVALKLDASAPAPPEPHEH